MTQGQGQLCQPLHKTRLTQAKEKEKTLNIFTYMYINSLIKYF